MKMCKNPSLSACITLLLLIIGRCSGAGLMSQTEAFTDFIRAIDPQNVLRVSWNGRIPHPCSNNWKGVGCNFKATTVTEIRLENQNLTGTIDADSLCQLQNLRVLSLAGNHIHGSVPHSLLYCRKLTYLNLSSNKLGGRIPVFLTDLKHLTTLDISNNHFTVGVFPRLKPEIEQPDKYSKKQAAGYIYKLRKMVKAVDESPSSTDNTGSGEPTSGSGNKVWYDKPILVIPLALLIVICTVFMYFGIKRITDHKATLKSLAPSPQKAPPPVAPEPVEDVKPIEKGSELVFFVEEQERFGLNDLLETTAELQRQTSCSSLYKVILRNNSVYAVKRLKKLQVSQEEFSQTMKRIGDLKHPNILPLVGYNSNNDEKLLIYRYQTNGSLLNLFDDNIEGKREFPWKLRLSIATGIARGLDFIYQNSTNRKVVPHGNLKLSNILLDENNEPKISEYGIAWCLDPKKSSIYSSNGYLAPEKTLSEQGDVFSFGIILLELLTGKTVEKSGIDLPKWVKSMVREEWTGEVFDKEVTSAARQYAFPLLNVALKCVSKLPEDRPSMAEVMEKMEEVVNSNDDNDVTLSSMASIESGSQDWSMLHSVIPETWDTPGSNY
ncbi:hypothetical protein Tsubulata_031604 [Turnera subulata]|uniref:Protein kinase domain-containing protein n=1 Tax=Turnera subulata TaxID=218843 RepID=A0A9Q0FBB8_9ROSI|nr:hypothetical protein Tsubulata_031604 [Turnera subulata]